MRLSLGIAGAAVLLALPGTTAATPAAGTPMHWTIDGVQRTAIVFVPVSTTGGARHPLVFAWHGHGGNAQGTSMQMHLQTLWPQAIVVYPQGLNSPTPGDPTATKPGWQFKAGDANDRDLKLFDAMVATLKAKYRIDTRRIYTTGFSNGGIFSYLLWAERPKTIAAIGEVAGRLDPAETLTVPRALLAIAGRNDTTNPFQGQVDSMNAARQVNGATGAGTPCGPICTRYDSPGANKTPVVTLIHRGAHVYPPWAPPLIVKFFRNHPQP
jgi:polyhydroxybutyrate depolymerase